MSNDKRLKAFSVMGALFTLLAVAILAAACGGGSNTGQSGVTINYKVVGAEDGDVGPDGKKHDTFKTLDSTTIQLGQAVTLNFTNTDKMPHSYTLPELGINVTVPGAKNGKDGSASYTFTADRAGTFRWFCALPCDDDNNGWAMTASQKGTSQDNFMAGYITVR